MARAGAWCRNDGTLKLGKDFEELPMVLEGLGHHSSCMQSIILLWVPGLPGGLSRTRWVNAKIFTV